MHHKGFYEKILKILIEDLDFMKILKSSLALLWAFMRVYEKGSD